jgi:hypothetical protein
MEMKRVANDTKEIMDFADAVTTVIRNKDDGYLREILKREFKFGDKRINRVLEAMSTMRKQITSEEVDEIRKIMDEKKD